MCHRTSMFRNLATLLLQPASPSTGQALPRAIKDAAKATGGLVGVGLANSCNSASCHIVATHHAPSRRAALRRSLRRRRGSCSQRRMHAPHVCGRPHSAACMQVLTVLVAHVTYGDEFTWLSAAGMGVLLVGVGLFNFQQYRKRQAESPVSARGKGGVATGGAGRSSGPASRSGDDTCMLLAGESDAVPTGHSGQRMIELSSGWGERHNGHACSGRGRGSGTDEEELLAEQ